MGRARPDEAFPTDEPLKTEALIGRAADISEITTKLKLGINTVLAAPRRTGKTSVCNAVLNALAAEPDFYVAKVDLFKVDSIGSFADELVRQVISNRPALKQALHVAKQSGRSLYEGLSLGLSAKAIAPPDLQGLDISLLPRLSDDPVAHLDYALGLAQKVAAADGKRLLLFIDEFQDVERIGESWQRGWAGAMKRKMRGFFQDSPDVSFLFSGSLEHMMRQMFGSTDEPFFQFGSFHDLRVITSDEWHDGLPPKFSQDQTTVSDEALDYIITRGEGHPRATMLIAQRAHLNAIIAGTHEVNLDLAAVAYEAALRGERGEHEAYIVRARNLGKAGVNRLTVPTLTRIAAGEAPYGGSRSHAPVQRAIYALRDAGLITPNETRGWRVGDPLFAEYLRRERP